MAVITDIDKLRPGLTDKSYAELERQAEEIRMAIAAKRHQDAIAEKEALAQEAAGHIEAVVAGVKWLHANGVLPEKIAAAFSRADGMFAPGMHLRVPTAESMVPIELRTKKARKPRAKRT